MTSQVKVQYRVTTVSAVDGKPFTKTYTKFEAALEDYKACITGMNSNAFATFGRRYVYAGGHESFSVIHSYMSANMQNAANRPVSDALHLVQSGAI